MDRPWDGAVRRAVAKTVHDDRHVRVELECGHFATATSEAPHKDCGAYEMPQFYVCPACRAAYDGSARQREVEAAHQMDHTPLGWGPL